jgi:hypothetical protein
MDVTYKLIETVTVGVGGAASIEFTSIPQTYTDLKLAWSTRTTNAATSNSHYLYFNTLNTNFSFKRLRGTGSAADSYAESSGNLYNSAVGANATASIFSNGEIYIPNYTGSTNKSFSVDTVAEDNATTGITVMFAGLWSNTAAITNIKFLTQNS